MEERNHVNPYSKWSTRPQGTGVYLFSKYSDLFWFNLVFQSVLNNNKVVYGTPLGDNQKPPTEAKMLLANIVTS